MRFQWHWVCVTRRTFSAFVVSLLLCLTACASSVHRSFSSQKSFHQITIGLCEDYPEESRSLEAARRDLLLLKTNNIRVLRIAFGWDAMEPERGKYDWSFWDDFVQTAAESGVQLIPYICYTPKWASSDQGTNFWRAPPKNPEVFKNFVSKIVSRYKSSIHSWEIWNEPDNPAYWSGTVEDFAKLLKAGSEGVRESDRTAKVVSGGIAWNLDFLRQLFEEHGISPFIDIVNIHNYNETWAAEPLENIYDIIKRAKKIIAAQKGKQSIWFAEVGYSDYRKGKFVSEIYEAQFPFEHTAEYQGVSIGRAISVAAATEAVPLLAWYRIHDLAQRQDIIGDVNNRHLGVLNLNQLPKPALSALTFFHFLFQGPVRCLDGEVRSTQLIASDIELHFFEKKEGEVFAVAWLRPLSDRALSRDELFGLAIPFPVGPIATFFNHEGERIKDERLRQEHGASCLKNIVLHEGALRVILFH